MRTRGSILTIASAPSLAAALAVTVPAAAAAQQPDFRWEKALAADKSVEVHNLNGRITIVASTSGKVEVNGFRRGGRSDDVTMEVYEHEGGISVCPIFRDADTECDATGFHMHSRRSRRDRDWEDLAIDMEVRVPRGLRITAGNVSGDVRVSGAEGALRASSVSGDVRLDGLRARSVRATSVSGDVMVAVDELLGDGALDFSTVSGNATVELPKTLDADVTLRTLSGALDSDFPLTLNGRMSRGRIEARIGKGGRELSMRTVSGDVRLRMAGRRE